MPIPIIVVMVSLIVAIWAATIFLVCRNGSEKPTSIKAAPKHLYNSTIRKQAQ